MTTAITLREVSELDAEMRQLVGLYSHAKIKIGLELAKRLKRFDEERLYKRLDEQSYPTFPAYLTSLNIAYKTAREIIGLYEAFVLAGGYTIDELAEAGYHKLTTIKPLLFRREVDGYKLTTTRDDADKWIADAKSDMTQIDLAQKRREHEVGDHEHTFKKVTYRICQVCKLREIASKE